MNEKSICIHQANYLPWAGFFNKNFHSDVYVVFDDVQLPRGKNFVVRNKIKTQSGEKWLRIPVYEKSNMILQKDVKINNDLNWNEKHWNSINENYKQTKFFSEYKNQFEIIYMKKWEKLIELNLEIIKLIMKILKIESEIKFSSELNISSKGTEKILDIIKKLDGKKYISGTGTGSKRYLNGKEEMFEKEGIVLEFKNFQTQDYQQMYEKIIPNLSIIDMLFNIGSKKTREIISV